jgi:hypothetical protein
VSFFWIVAANADAISDTKAQKNEIHSNKMQQDADENQKSPDDPGKASALKTQKDQVNYAIGVNLIGNFKQQGIDIDLNLVIKGMQDALSGKKLLLGDAELRKATMVYQSEVRRKQAEARAAATAGKKDTPP